MAHGVREAWVARQQRREGKAVGSRRIFSPQFKLQVLDSYRRDPDCRGNQRATARKYGIHRRQIQKWLQMENALRSAAGDASDQAALNLAGGQPRLQGTSTPPSDAEPILNVDKTSDSEDSLSVCSDQEQALDFTCAALSRKKIFSAGFKLQVVDAYYRDPTCCGDQRVTAKKFDVHRRQVQKWLETECLLRNEADTECLDLSNKRRLETFDYDDCPPSKKTFVDLDSAELATNAQETALCLIKHQPTPPPEVTSSMDLLYRPYTMCCSVPEPSPYEHTQWTAHYYPHYYTGIHTSYVTKWLHQDAQYYKQAVKDINLYTPLHS